MKLIAITLLVISSLVVANDPHNNSGYNNRSIVKCSSKNNHRKTCNADTSGGVQLIKQLSRSSCHDNWGYSHNQIWVDNGCRAKFRLYVDSGRAHNNNSQSNSYNNNTHNNSGDHNNSNSSNRYNNNPHGNNTGYNNQVRSSSIICESINSRRNSCSIPHGVKVSLHKQISRSSCAHNWGYNDNHIWVANGCRAEFTINNIH